MANFFPSFNHHWCGECGEYEELERKRSYRDLVFDWCARGRGEMIPRYVWTWWGGRRGVRWGGGVRRRLSRMCEVTP